MAGRAAIRAVLVGRAVAFGHPEARSATAKREVGEPVEIGALGRVYPVLLDVTDYDAIPAAVTAAEREAGPVDVLVNNAGYGHDQALEESSIKDLQRQFAAKVFGPVAMTKAGLPGMRARGRGHIINVNSMGGFITMPGITFYCGSKIALEGISEALGKEVASFGIRVTALAPGEFRTDWVGRSMDRTPRSTRRGTPFPARRATGVDDGSYLAAPHLRCIPAPLGASSARKRARSSHPHQTSAGRPTAWPSPAGTARRSKSRSPSTPTPARSWPGLPRPVRASAAR
ncbi:SDR family NAD(P)-dependent oxidoreductase [Pararoseomonas sp. SCSIO 73927]|uniref:SDR family NAD(P)-dependent oxidoreductase n=1 Tax=Pararoseomonas sp. SCSIO 73927 TaxID=3114537 RepID=UPI0030CC62FF